MKQGKKEKIMIFTSHHAARRSCGRGFTLLELMISMALLAIMISAAIISLLPARNQARLKTVQAEVATTIKTIQSYALQGRVTDGGVPAGYGFKLTGGQTYEIFYCTTPILCGSDPAQDQKIGSTFSTQDRGVTISSSGGTRFYFDIPNGRLNPEADLEMTLSLGGSSKKVTVKKSGSVLEE